MARPLRERGQVNYTEGTPAKWKTPAKHKKQLQDNKAPAGSNPAVNKENEPSPDFPTPPELNLTSSKPIKAPGKRRGRPPKVKEPGDEGPTKKQKLLNQESRSLGATQAPGQSSKGQPAVQVTGLTFTNGVSVSVEASQDNGIRKAKKQKVVKRKEGLSESARSGQVEPKTGKKITAQKGGTSSKQSKDHSQGTGEGGQNKSGRPKTSTPAEPSQVTDDALQEGLKKREKEVQEENEMKRRTARSNAGQQGHLNSWWAQTQSTVLKEATLIPPRVLTQPKDEKRNTHIKEVTVTKPKHATEVNNANQNKSRKKPPKAQPITEEKMGPAIPEKKKKVSKSPKAKTVIEVPKTVEDEVQVDPKETKQVKAEKQETPPLAEPQVIPVPDASPVQRDHSGFKKAASAKYKLKNTGQSSSSQSLAFKKLQEMHQQLQEKYDKLKSARLMEADALFEEQQRRVAAHVQASDNVIKHWKDEAARLSDILRREGLAEKDDEIKRLTALNLELKEAIFTQEQKYLEVCHQHTSLGHRLQQVESKLQASHSTKTSNKSTATATPSLVSLGCSTEHGQLVEGGTQTTPVESLGVLGAHVDYEEVWVELVQVVFGFKVELCEAGRAVFLHEQTGYSFDLRRCTDEDSTQEDGDWMTDSEQTGGLEMRYRPLTIGKLQSVLLEDDLLLGEGDIPVQDVPKFLARIVRLLGECKEQ